MFGFFKIKALLCGMFLATPAVAAWVFRNPDAVVTRPEVRSISYNSTAPRPQTVVRVPVEVVAEGSAPRWIYVEVGSQAVPEPGIASLLALGSLLLILRRQRNR